MNTLLNKITEYMRHYDVYNYDDTVDPRAETEKLLNRKPIILLEFFEDILEEDPEDIEALEILKELESMKA